jgi:nucleoid DNA-binding protein
MNLTDFSQDIAKEFDIPNYKAKKLLSFLTKLIAQKLIFGIEVTFREVGTFRLSVRQPKKYLNLQTNKWCLSKKSYYLNFIATLKMKTKLKNKTVH